ncbi:MAG TPA: hypothetical protein VNM14_06555 [Planctomycetota bacterium]|jgi:hypothetical protein|nr:hypothetical protein [Planctomycetota bacterium]
MVKCHKCGTGWTSQGLPICPICGARVEEPAAAAKVAAAPVAAVVEKAAATRSAVLEAPAEPPKVQLKKVDPVPFVPTVKIPEPVAQPRVEAPKLQIQKVEPAPSEPVAKSVEPAKPRLEAEPVVQTVVMKAPAPKTEIRQEAPVTESYEFERLQLSDPSALSLPVMRELRTTSRPLNGPLILGALAYLGVFLLPLTVAFESSRVLGVLGFCMTAFFAPFAPIAWMAGLSVEKRRREQGLRPENPVALGRLLGQWATLLLVSEVTLALIAIAALRLSGRFPFSFWAPFY